MFLRRNSVAFMTAFIVVVVVFAVSSSSVKVVAAEYQQERRRRRRRRTRGYIINQQYQRHEEGAQQQQQQRGGEGGSNRYHRETQGLPNVPVRRGNGSIIGRARRDDDDNNDDNRTVPAKKTNAIPNDYFDATYMKWFDTPKAATGCTGVKGEDPLPLSNICLEPTLGGNEGPEGLSAFCGLLDLTGVAKDLGDEGTDYTVFAPNNKAIGKMLKISLSPLSEDESTNLLYYHVIQGKKCLPADLLCNSFVDAIFTEGKSPKIKCVDDIVGKTNNFLVGPGNNEDKLNNLPRLSRGSEVISPVSFCNGAVYVIDNVILPKFMKKKFNNIIIDPE